jgi:5-formyltetrahydrofolate cyclo-ligase
VPVDHISLFIVPGLAFDANGNRLGWGAGHYDVTLSKNLEALRVGFAYEAQIVDTVPAGPHDLPMHMTVTEAGVRRHAVT